MVALGTGAERQHAEIMRQQLFQDKTLLCRMFTALQLAEL